MAPPKQNVLSPVFRRPPGPKTQGKNTLPPGERGLKKEQKFSIKSRVLIGTPTVATKIGPFLIKKIISHYVFAGFAHIG